MLTSKNIAIILTRLAQIRPAEPEIQKELKDLVKYIVDKASDPDWEPVEDTDSSEDESGGEEEGHIIDRTDPHFISIA